MAHAKPDGLICTRGLVVSTGSVVLALADREVLLNTNKNGWRTTAVSGMMARFFYAVFLQCQYRCARSVVVRN